MSELDVEKLRQLRDRRWEPGLTEPAALGELQAALPVIIEVWEDRDRLQKTLKRIDAVVERMYLPPEFAHFQAELCRILTLEGRDA